MKAKACSYIIGFFLLCCLSNLWASGLIESERWVRSYGGTQQERAYAIEQIDDGGYIIAGETSSYGNGGYDAWIMKIDAEGAIVWQYTYGGPQNDSAHSIQQTDDCGFIVAGYTSSYGAGGIDVWVFHIDSSGIIEWQKALGGTANERAYQIQQTVDKGYIIAGETESFGAGMKDMWIIKLDAKGNIIWQRTYGTSNYAEAAYSVQEVLPYGGYIVAGIKFYNTYEEGWAWLIRLDANGLIQWEKQLQTPSGNPSYSARTIQQTNDEGFIVAGYIRPGNCSYTGYWVAKTDHAGGIIWSKEYGASVLDSYSYIYSIKQTNDGGYIFAGQRRVESTSPVALEFYKLSSSGDISYQRLYSIPIIINSVAITSDGGYVLAGEYAYSTRDLIVFKIDNEGSSSCPLPPSEYPPGGSCNPPVVAINPSIQNAPTNAIISDTTVQPIASNTQALIPSPCQSPGAVPDNDNYPGAPFTISKNASSDNLLLTWSAPGGNCMTYSYAIYRGMLPWSDYNHNAVNCYIMTTSTSLNNQTDSYYYLVVARYPYSSSGAEGSYGLDSLNNQRPPASSNPCGTQFIGSCN